MSKSYDSSEWRVSQAEFKGYMKSKIDSIDKSLQEFTKEQKRQEDRLNKTENRITAVEVKGGIYGFVAGLLSGFVGGFLK